jgi:hypothetical protein
VDGASVFYHYRLFHKDRWSIWLNLGNDHEGNPIPKLRVLVYLPTRGRRWALKGWVKPGQELGKPKKRGVVVHIAGGGFTMYVTQTHHPIRKLSDHFTLLQGVDRKTKVISVEPSVIRSELSSSRQTTSKPLSTPTHKHSINATLSSNGSPAQKAYSNSYRQKVLPASRRTSQASILPKSPSVVEAQGVI